MEDKLNLKALFEEKKAINTILKRTIDSLNNDIAVHLSEIFKELENKLKEFDYLLCVQPHYHELHISIFQSTDDKEADKLTHFAIINYKIINEEDAYIPKNIYDLVQSFLDNLETS